MMWQPPQQVAVVSAAVAAAAAIVVAAIAATVAAPFVGIVFAPATLAPMDDRHCYGADLVLDWVWPNEI